MHEGLESEKGQVMIVSGVTIELDAVDAGRCLFVVSAARSGATVVADVKVGIWLFPCPPAAST
jgi:hypothetical protein